ncbi:glycoside hydrolase [Lentinula edodes]|uniref:glycoside hydrolase n=1 Tax=Lentinula edodes TaxID=5353 RepID=UPI001E8D1B0D|nr:glycoside hydrolase [Lentinula edodes]KAH7869164.1 glycoside hydrolase [Lentinula edodes]
MLGTACLLGLGSAILYTTSFSLTPVNALRNGVGRLPALGYNTWNAYGCNIDEDLVLEAAQLMVSLGLQTAGYEYVNIDDCYAEKNRSENGDIVANSVRFSRGMNNLTDQIHALGFKTGIYSDSGWFTCGGYPGSFQNELRDARTFQDWGFDYLKFDNCAIPFDDVIREGMIGKFTRMADALAHLSKKSGKPPFLFSLCQWGWEQVWLWGSTLGHSWRVTGDISPNWDSLTLIINFNSFITQATDFHGHNDMDMLQLGNGGLTFDEAKSHFTAWALMKSPLLIGTNLSAITPEILEILTNTEILAINQDPVVGKSISPFRWGVNPDWTSNSSFPAQYYSGPSENGTVFMLLNTLNETSDMFFNLTESPWIRAGREYSVRDLWTHTENGTAIRNFTATNVPPHGVVALLLKDTGDEPEGIFPPCAVPSCSFENGTIFA